MSVLDTALRNQLDRAIVQARDAAEEAAAKALQALAVEEREPRSSMTPDERQLRVKLRAVQRRLGQHRDLIQACAYEHWHRMLFARFLAENDLLLHPEHRVSVTLEECADLTREQGEDDQWVVAARFAAAMLPGIFPQDDPLLQVRLAPEDRLRLEQLVEGLPLEVFTSDDGLGWTYQYWQSKEKDEVNRSGVKIGASELPAVTQLFTEPYMVNFLLHNTIGAWWAAKSLTAEDAENATTEDELRRKLALPGVRWEYLRFIRGEDGEGGPWRPAAGLFNRWPQTAAKLKVLDPCCGSGHFLVAALRLLVPIRMAEEGLTARKAVDAVLRDNLHGLEIDERCCQIAAFALALAAWAFPGTGYRPLPTLSIACTGVGPQATAKEWPRLAGRSGIRVPSSEREAIRKGLLNLHGLFSQAPTLGSLINPADLPGDLLAAGYQTIKPYLSSILKDERSRGDEEVRERAVAAAGMVKAADLLASHYTLVVTNVPYLGRGSHNDVLLRFGEGNNANADLCTLMLRRSFALLAKGGTCASVLPQNWWTGRDYRFFRRDLLAARQIVFAVVLGEEAWRAFGNRGPNTVLMVFNNEVVERSRFFALDLSTRPNAPVVVMEAKDDALRGKAPIASGRASAYPHLVDQGRLRKGRDWRILIFDRDDATPLSQYVDAGEGCSTGDKDRFVATFWEVSGFPSWFPYNSPGSRTSVYCDSSQMMLWENGHGVLAASRDARIQNMALWKRDGILVGRVRGITAALSVPGAFTKGAVMVAPRTEADTAALYCFVTSEAYEQAVRALDARVSAATSVVTDVAFDLIHWRKVAADRYPNGLPEPESNDPTQRLFHGRPEESTTPPQVGVARLLGYRWPAELDDTMRLSKRARALVKCCDELSGHADPDGIVCLPAVLGEPPAVDRLRGMLRAAYGGEWDLNTEPRLLEQVGYGGKSLEAWMRDGFFEQHAKLFHNRPFIWHIWDGRRDGFSALVNYHSLDRAKLEKLIYSYLGEWIARQQAEVKAGTPGAEARSVAAQELREKLELILKGEPPHDIYVRWKPLHEQPIGWEPDLNDGARVNIRPFILPFEKERTRTWTYTQSVLRAKFTINWNKDRGRNPDGSERFNDRHHTIAEKQTAREATKQAARETPKPPQKKKRGR